jgi:hypothetical protein
MGILTLTFRRKRLDEALANIEPRVDDSTSTYNVYLIKGVNPEASNSKTEDTALHHQEI